MSSKHEQKLLDATKKLVTDGRKTASKNEIQEKINSNRQCGWKETAEKNRKAVSKSVRKDPKESAQTPYTYTY